MSLGGNGPDFGPYREKPGTTDTIPHMPITPEQRRRYGPDWETFSKTIRFTRAQSQCECAGECGRGTHDGRCPNKHKQPAYGTGSRVILTVAHLCHTPECRTHVLAMCQGCHFAYDREEHARTRAIKRGETVPPRPLCPQAENFTNPH